MKRTDRFMNAAPRLIIPLVAALLGGGCTSAGGNRGTTPAPAAADTQDRSRAERVFLYQSRVADALLERYPLTEVLERADPGVVETEARMSEACGPLTQAVLARLEGEQPSFRLRLRVMTTVEDRERAAQNMDLLLHTTAVTDAI